MGTILTDIKKLLGIVEEDTSFDTDIMIHINSVISTLTQLGVGSSSGFVADENSKWTDYLGDTNNLELVKSYIYLRVRMLFDPPTNSASSSFENQIKELEWRINIMVDRGFDRIDDEAYWEAQDATEDY